MTHAFKLNVTHGTCHIPMMIGMAQITNLPRRQVGGGMIIKEMIVRRGLLRQSGIPMSGLRKKRGGSVRTVIRWRTTFKETEVY